MLLSANVYICNKKENEMNTAQYIYKWIRKHLLKVDDRSQLEIAIANGLKIGKNAAIMGGVIIDPGHCFLIEIGDNVTLAPRVHVLAHDASTKRELNYTRIAPVKIGSDVFIGAGSIILPGVTIGNKCIIGAGSVVTKDIPENSVAVGNPCKVINTYDSYMNNNRDKLINDSYPKFSADYQIGKITDEMKAEMKSKLERAEGFII